MDIQKYLEVVVISPKQVLFNDHALAVSSKNSTGLFDILPYHANFVTFIENYPITIRKMDNQEVRFQFPFAIIYQMNNKVQIYTDITIPTLSK